MQAEITDWTLDRLVEDTTAHFVYTITDSDLSRFAELSGDRNPLHTDVEYARRCGFRDRVVHGAYLVALVSQLIGMRLPGRRSQLLSLALDFAAPTFPGDTMIVQGKIESIHPGPAVVQLRLTIRCDGELRARGSAMIRLLGERV